MEDANLLIDDIDNILTKNNKLSTSICCHINTIGQSEIVLTLPL